MSGSLLASVGTFFAGVGRTIIDHPYVSIAITAEVLLASALIYTVRRISKLKAELANIENELGKVSKKLANVEYVQKSLEAKLIEANRLIENARHEARMRAV
ncbi:MAG: hypothetical protein LBF25_03195 [Puniceicoccales bacterium]|jgi:septal ring factor EnvC (AmiA/AmiB activator)|nr:hypothetical protein [Puniceicoccales bacterium]